MTVEQILDQKGYEVVTIGPDQPANDALRVLCRKKIGALVVVDADNHICGIVSERDLIQACDRWEGQALKMPVSRLCSSPVIACDLGDSIEEIMKLMTQRRIRHVPVIQGGKLRGIISIGDVVKMLLEESQQQIQSLKDYLYGQGTGT